MTKQLILGAARSGKSREAELRAAATGKQLIYIATATAGDAEMAERIQQHRAQRGGEWHLVEEEQQLTTALMRYNSSANCVLVDCLTLWLSNCLLAGCWPAEKTRLVGCLDNFEADLIMVGNEVGSGIVPMGELSRQFVDQNGWLHQALAKRCDRVSLVVAGLPMELK